MIARRRRSFSFRSPGCCSSQCGAHTYLSVGKRFVFPNSHNGPACALKTSVHLAISCNVAVQLWTPVVDVLSRFRSMLRTAVPEASVYEDGYPSPRECDIDTDLPSAIRANWIVLPEPEAGSMEHGPQSDLRSGVALRVTAHHGRHRSAGWSGVRVRAVRLDRCQTRSR